MEKQIEQLEILYPEKARGVTKFNVPLAHMIIAGADFMLVPSRFEPCGLIQLHAMRYGTVNCLRPFLLFIYHDDLTCQILHGLDWLSLHGATLPQVPIVASTGGLHDTVKEGFTGFQMGAFNVEVSKWLSMLLCGSKSTHFCIFLLVWQIMNLSLGCFSVWGSWSSWCDCNSNICQESSRSLWHPGLERDDSEWHGPRSFMEGQYDISLN